MNIQEGGVIYRYWIFRFTVFQLKIEELLYKLFNALTLYNSKNK